jgi:predicted metallopeptidase
MYDMTSVRRSCTLNDNDDYDYSTVKVCVFCARTSKFRLTNVSDLWAVVPSIWRWNEVYEMKVLKEEIDRFRQQNRYKVLITYTAFLFFYSTIIFILV